jgi:serine/threonine-protein kinase
VNPRNFFAELKRRNVYKVAVAYAVVAWLLIQVATQVFPFFEIPNWAVRLTVLVIVIGLPIALVIAWAFELTPEGIKRTEDSMEAPKPRGGSVWIYLVLVGAALSIGLFFIGRYTARSGTAPGSSITEKSIAVLPLVNQSGDPAQEYFSDGLSEELINGLGQIHELRVIGRNSSFQFKGKSGDSRAVGLALGVAHLLEGSVRKSGERVRISVQLVKTADGSQRWSQIYDRELKDIFAVQEEIAKSVADQLRIRLLGTEVAASAQPSNGSIEAYNAYLRGQQYNQLGNIEGLTRSIAFLDEAIRLDPHYADAYALKSLAWAQIGTFRGAKGSEAFELARTAAKAALAAKPDLPRAHGAMAYIHMIVDWDLAAAEEALRGAAQNTRTSANMLANVRGFQGRTDDAIRLQEQAVAFDPAFGLFRRNLASRLVMGGQLEGAERELRKAIELQPQASGIHYELAIVLLLRGQPEAAWEQAQLESSGLFRDLAIALAQAARGNGAEADAALKVLVESHGEGFPFRIAGVYAYRKEPDKVFEWLERAYILHDPRLISLLADPLLRPYQADPRFGELCRKMRLPVPK